MNRVDRADGVRLVTDSPHVRPPVSPEHDREREIDALLEAAKPERDVVCLLSRLTAGLGVQALWSPTDGTTWITVVLNGATETFEVPGENLAEAFEHPYVFGATLPL
jgi:hypothetical protein